MNFIQTLLDGEQGAFKSKTLTPMQKLTLRFVVVGLIYYGFAVIEGMLMRIYEVNTIPGMEPKQFFAIMTAHPLVGIFGSTYSIVFGAFLFLVPFLMKKPLWSIKLGNWTFVLVAVGTLTFWTAGFFRNMRHYIRFTGHCRLTLLNSALWAVHFLYWVLLW
ncbi:MAG TPA: cbb3-type cytochrome c oxidase subunit I [Bacteroidales bacterium]|nr:cbb3-type cytochrome c oxidase subunit I [Bacteroidales bacterium]